MSLVSQAAALRHGTPYPITDRKVVARITLERRIIQSLVDELLAQGCRMTVDNGEDRPVVKSADRNRILAELHETDEDRLIVSRPDGAFLGTVLLVYGNDGYDVMCDWHVALDPFMPKTLALAEKLSA